MKIKKNIALSDSGFVFDPATGNSFTTNPIGLEIIQLLKSEKTEKEILTEITSGYVVEMEMMERDLSDFISVLIKMRLAE